MLMDGIEPPSSRRNGDYGDALPLSYVSIIQKCLHLCITITACDKKYYAITKEELSSPIIV